MPASLDNPATTEERTIIRVPAAEAGAEMSVASEAGGNLSFAFDPSAATATRNDNDLVFELDGGGKVTISGFFEVGDNSLPDLTLPDGLVVSAIDFFDGSDLDLSTAAGPGAVSVATSGGASYDDNSGSITAGLDSLGTLGTFYWGKGAEVTEVAEGAKSFSSFDGGEEAPSDPGTLTKTTASITTTNVWESDTGTVVFAIELSNSPQGDAVALVQVGDTIHRVQIDAEGKGILVLEHGNAEDVYTDPTSVTATVVGVEGGGYEYVQEGAAATAHISDTETPVTVSLEVINGGTYYEGDTITLKITLDNDAYEHAPTEDLHIELSTGHIVVIPKGETSLEFTLNAADLGDGVKDGQLEIAVADAYYEGQKDSSVKTNYELLDHGEAAAKVTVVSTIDPENKDFKDGLTVDETFIPGKGSQVDPSADSGATSHQTSGSFTTPAFQLDGMTVNDKPLVTGLKINTDEGVFEITGVNKATGEVSYTYTLTAAYEHAADTGPDQIAEGVNKFEFKVNGLSVGVLNVNIEDDAPLISIDGGSAQSIDLGMQADSTELKFTAEGLIERNYGADNAKTTDDASRDGTEEYITIKHYSVIEGSSTADPGNPNSWDSHTLTNVNFIDGKAEVDLGGRGLLYLTKTEQGLEYTYIAKNGTVGDEEHITIGITDSDGDYAGVTLDVNMNYPVPAGTALIDEAGLENGSHHPGWFGSEGTVPLHLDEGTVSVCWDIDSMPALKADIGDGYQDVTWVQGNGEGEGSKLFAKVGDTVVLEVSPNVVEGSMDVILNYPVDHSSSDSSLGLLLPYTPETVNNNGMPNNVHITIKDDHPMPLSDVEILAEPDTASYNVYLALDVSGSMYQDIATNKYDAKGDVPTDNTRMHAALDALQVLVQSYKDAGADARFTLLEFGSSGAIVKDGVTADEMLTYLKAQDYMSKTSGQGTNYAALSQLQSEIEADLSLSTYQGWENKVYFLSDGAPDSGKPAPSTWQNTMDQLNVDVISVGIDVGSSTNAQKALKSVANSGDEVINVSLATGDYDSLTEALLDTMEQKLSGNLLGNDVASADGMNLDSITFGETTYSFTLPDGAVVDSVTIDLGNGLTMTVEKDGDYTLIAKNNIADDYTVEGLKYTVSDNDGDTREASVTITLRDSSPLAHDNVAQGHSPASLLDTFTDGSSWESAGGDVVWDHTNVKNATSIPGATGALNPDNKGVLLTANGTDEDSANAFKALVTDSTLDSVAKVAEAAGMTGTVLDGTAIAKDFTLDTPGTITFNWMFEYGRIASTAYDLHDGAIWVLKDENGNIVDVGKITQGVKLQYNGGVTEIPVSAGGQYTLVIAVVDVDSASAKANLNARLFVDDMIFTPGVPLYYEGNVVTDASPDGNVDQLFDKAFLSSIEVDGNVYSFTSTAQTETIVIEGKGTLVMMGSGAYRFTPTDPNADLDDVDILYTLKDQDGDTGSAWLYIRSDAHNIAGTSGDDAIVGTGGHDVISGGAGNDVIHGGDGDDAIYGGDGNDKLYGDAGDDTLRGGDGDDILVGGEGSDELHGDAGNDVLFGDGAPAGSEDWTDSQWQAGLQNYLDDPNTPSNPEAMAIKAAAEGAGESDTLYGGSGDDIMFGQGGDDLLHGGDGNDFIHGGAGNDTIYGGAGDDTMMGGSGDNVFAWKTMDYDGGTDTILDFSLGQDKLGFEDLFAGETASPEVFLTMLNNNTINVDIKSQNEVTIQLDHQTVDIHLEGNGIGTEIMDQYYAGDEDAAKAALLQQMLIDICG